MKCSIEKITPNRDSSPFTGDFCHINTSQNALSDMAVVVLMCVHAGANSVEFDQALASMKAQTYSNLRIYVYCDGPLKPAHEKVLSFYLNTKSGDDLIIRADQPKGLPTGLNILIEHALSNPEIIFFARMDADDISMPERIRVQVNYFLQNPAVSIFGTWCFEFAEFGKAIFHKKLPTSMNELLKFSLTRSPLIHPTVMLRRAVFESGYRYKKELKLMQDYDLWTRLLIDGYQISNIPEYLLWFRVADNFYMRRTGFRRAWTEVSMRLSYAKKVNKISFIYLLKLSLFFVIRISPEFIKRFSYKYLRR